MEDAMGELKFSDNYNDLCKQSGVNAGFQFEFFCERCNDTWRSEFVPFRSGQASGWLGKAGGLLGGVLGGAGEALEGLAESGWGKARDAAFSAAIQSARDHFHRCTRCFQYVCDTCWNEEKGLCLNCAPSAEVEIEAARAQGEVYAAGEKAALEGIQRGKQMDVKRDRQLVCPQCGAETKGAKFCPECGAKLAVHIRCPGCSREISPGTKFCPECGKKLEG
jgi:rRNA maturation endonuclease Nob1